MRETARQTTITVTEGGIQERFGEYFEISQTRSIDVIDFLGRCKVGLIAEREINRAIDEISCKSSSEF